VLGVVAALIAAGPTPFDGPPFEILLKARSLLAPPTEPPDAAAVAVIAIDPRSLDEPELAKFPRTMMAAEWGRVLDVVFGAGAKAIGFDVLFLYSANRFIPDFDAPFLAALSRHRERVVLARSVTTVPAMPFVFALRSDPGAFGLGELAADRDGGYRRVPPEYRTADNDVVPGLAAAVLRRGKGPTMSEAVVVAPARHLETLPTYALIDVLRCGDAPEALARAFRDKFVFVGTTMPDEDRRYTSGRFLAPPTASGPPLHACGLHRLAASVPHSATVPGVYIHAAAVDAVARNRVVATASTPVVASVAGVSGGLGAVAGFALTPWLAFTAVVVLTAVLFAGATVALASNVWVPVALPFGALIAAPVLAYVVRYVVEDRVRRRIEKAFSHYLAPAVVERLSRDAAALRLGGELREVTLIFADLSGFTALSGRVSAEVLTRVTNEYLGYIVAAVEETGGYVDKFIGDAVMAIWGAPAADPKHAVNAVRAALAAVARVRAEHARAEARGELGYGVKIGVNSGPAVVGNVGTEKRYNYTAIGETVNVAARLESVPGIYTCDVVVGPQTRELAAGDFFWIELDAIRVKGREAPLALWQPLGPIDAATPEQHALARQYADALAHYRAMRFAEAAAGWDALSAQARDFTAVANPSKVMAVRAHAFAMKPPPEPWDGVWVLTSK
jgi:class 3 adenylate cyclase/CHASE2 domain-containing sensor protein